MTGGYNFTGDAPPQPMIPIVAYWDDVDMVPWALPQVYDYMEGWDAASVVSPLQQEVYNRQAVSDLLRERAKDFLSGRSTLTVAEAPRIPIPGSPAFPTI